MGWFTRREIVRKGKTRIVHYAAVHAHVRRAATQHIHDGNPRPCKLAPPLFSPPACLDIYCFNLPWPCLIMESSFWPPTAARPHRLSRRFCVYTWRGRREERNGCSANRLWIRARCRASTLHVSRDLRPEIISERERSTHLQRGTRIPRLFSVDDKQACFVVESLNKENKKKEGRLIFGFNN